MKNNLLYIILLLCILNSCKKEEVQNSLAIRDFSEYNIHDYILYSDSFNLDNNVDYIIFDLDGDNNPDIRLSTYYNYQHVNNSIYFDFKLYVLNLTTDSSLKFSSTEPDTLITKPHGLGDEISENLNWIDSTAVIHHYGTNSNGAFSYYWNELDPTKTYFVFRKKTSRGIKYGWVNINENMVGPFVMQR